MKFLFLLLLPSLCFAKGFVPTSFSAQYEESQKSFSGKVKKIFGSFDYKYPGHVRLEVTSEPKVVFVSNPELSWYYTPAAVASESGQVAISKSSSHPVTRFLDSIQNGIESSKMFSSKWDGQDLKLAFTPSAQKEYSLKEVILHAKDGSKSMSSILNFDLITLNNMSGSTTSIRFIEIKENVNFSLKHFVFIIPPKTKITK